VPKATPSNPDDLKLVYGIGPVLEKRLHKLGIFTFLEISRWSDADVDRIEPQLDTVSGRIRREGWVKDARRLHIEKHGPIES
jgi:predicted flap endonuclease-1-like 5' DNA nuclease